MSTHTPGPWTFNDLNPIGMGKYVGSLGAGITGEIALVQSVGETGNADGRLMAAAPDLLDALRGLLIVYELTGDHVDTGGPDCWACRARAAIEKATGSSFTRRQP